jgi:hypothetical protein
MLQKCNMLHATCGDYRRGKRSRWGAFLRAIGHWSSRLRRRGSPYIIFAFEAPVS